MEKAMRVYYIHVNDAKKFMINLSRIRRNGWTIVNCCRPIQGAITWHAPSIEGVCYAAGKIEDFEDDWVENDAAQIKVVSNRQVRNILKKELSPEHWQTMMDMVQEEGELIVQEIAMLHRMPWR